MIKAYATEISYDISDSEKNQANKAIKRFEFASKALNAASSALDLMKTPFKNNPDIPYDEILKIRKPIRNFRDSSIDKFNNFKNISFECVDAMQAFESDTQTLKLMKSFINSIEELEDKVNEFSKLFDDLESKEFVKTVIDLIESIQNKCEEVDKIIDERIKTHIKTNILASTWVDSVGESLQQKIEKEKPLILEVFDKTQDQLANVIKERRVLD